MNGCFNVFHEEIESATRSQKVRNTLATTSIEVLSKHLVRLDSPTITIKTKDETFSFLQDHKHLKLSPKLYTVIPRNGDYHSFEPSMWSPAQVGIWASNYLAWKALSESTFDYALLLENDMIIEDGFFDALSDALQTLPTDWDVYFHYITKTNLSKLTNTEVHSLYRPSYFVSHASYVISKKGAQKAVKEIEDGFIIDFPVDWFFLNREHDYNVYTQHPTIPKGCRLAAIESSWKCEYIDMESL